MLFIVALTSLTYCLRTNGAVKDRFMGFYAEPKNSLDAVIIGSSSVFPYYITPKLYGENGVVLYPVSTNLQRPVAQKYLAEEVWKRQKPALLILEMRMYTGKDTDMTSNMAYTRGVTDNLRYSGNRIRAIREMVSDEVAAQTTETDVNRLHYYFDIFKYHENVRSLRLLSQWRSFRYAVPDPLKGYEGSSDVGPCTLEDHSDVKGTLPVPEEQEQVLRELLARLKEKGQETLFVVSPYAITKEQAMQYNYLQELVEEAGFSFLNMNRYYDEIGLVGEDDFSDYGVHTNVVGSEKVTRWFANYLEENYALPDRRGETAYASWQSAYDTWRGTHEEDIKTVQEHIRTKTYAETGE